MTVRFLLDEHIDPAVATALEPDVEAVPISRWHEGAYLGTPDEVLLGRAQDEGLALVTFDVATVPRLIRELAETGGQHAGVILVSAKSFPQANVGGLAKALRRVVGLYDDLDGHVLFVSRTSR